MDSLADESDIQTSFQNPFLDLSKDSQLDPSGPNFSTKAWLSNLIGFTSKDPTRYSRHNAGVSFRNLNVCGHGSPTDYQKTVGNVILEIGTIFRWMVGTGKQEIRILRDFNGLVNPGEMLLVLGRPGITLYSSCIGQVYLLTI
jgi:ATP-binding cassette subfamily G (WHITE) protein 2 (PDR)